MALRHQPVERSPDLWLLASGRAAKSGITLGLPSIDRVTLSHRQRRRPIRTASPTKRRPISHRLYLNSSTAGERARRILPREKTSSAAAVGRVPEKAIRY